MRFLIRTLAIASSFLFFACGLWAHGSTPATGMVHPDVQFRFADSPQRSAATNSDPSLGRFGEELQLTDEQKVQLKAIIEKEQGDISELRKHSLSPAKMEQRLHQIRLTALKEIMMILNDDQWNTFTHAGE
jgi:Spy/CpxP family protein refolding chaperone